MNHSEFFSALKKGDTAPCYLFEGREELTKRSALKALQAKVITGDFADMNYARLTDPAPDALIAAAETLPFLSDKRFLEIRDCAMLQGDKSKEYDEEEAVKRLSEYFDHLPDTVCMVFYVRGKADGRKKMYNVLKKKAVIVSFEPLEDRELTQWIAKSLQKMGKKISQSACQRLWFSAGRDLTLLENELGKLAAYVDGREEVTEEDVAAVGVQTTEYKVFDLTDALLSGRASQAMGMLETLLRDGEERLGLLPMLGRQCRQLKYARALSAQGVGPEGIAAQLGVPPFVARKTLTMARGFSLAQLNEICRLCLDTEYQVKSGQMMEIGSLEKVMLTILSMREGNKVG